MQLQSRIPEILGIQYPIVQGPMSWCTDAQMVAAISNAGGLGFLGPHAGQLTNPSSNEEVIERMRAEIRKVKALTDKPFGVPLLVSANLDFIPFMVDLVIEEDVPVVLISIISEEYFAKMKAAGKKIIFRPIDATPAVAQEAERLGADIIVATGFDEGGSLPSKTIGTYAVTQAIADAVQVPVMAAGGIATIEGVRAVFALGAEGVYAGTLFLATEEGRVHPTVKQMIVDSSAEDLLMYRSSFSFYRSLPTPFAEQLVAMDKAGASTEEITKVMLAGQGMREGMVKGNFEDGYISVGNGITYIDRIRPVREVIADLMRDFA